MAYQEDEYLMISGIQHFSFCRRQWALIHLEQQWGENHLTAEGRIIHERVHNPSLSETRGGTLTCRGVAVKSARLGITGECDAVEFIRCKNGITLFGKEGCWSVRPIEYKHGKEKINDCDRLQLTAQVMCLEEMFSCEIKEAFLFYHETRHRERVEITEELRRSADVMFAEMHDYARQGYTPTVKPSKKCQNCSLSDLCLPTIQRKISVTEYLKVELENDS